MFAFLRVETEVKLLRAIGLITATLGLAIMLLSFVVLLLQPQDLLILAAVVVGFGCIFGGMYMIFRD